MYQPNRLSGGQITRHEKCEFHFDGKRYLGFAGDTLASALLANDVRLVGRSFKYHRPRGIMTAGSEEPNALVTLRSGARAEPNTRATTIEMYDGLTASSQNRWPGLSFDAMAINDLFAPLLTAGFYYKTFMWPAGLWEKLYEPIIRRAAGLGKLSTEDDPDSYDKGFRHCDLLIIGAGPAGLMAALTAGRAGAEVILADEDFRMGGRLNSETFGIGDDAAADWAAATVRELESLPNVRLMPRTTVVGVFDHGIYSAVERVSDHLLVPPAGKPRQILWRIYAKQCVLAAGAIERPIAFEANDRPGIMTASAVRSYANRWAVTPAQDVTIFANNDDAHRTAADLHAKGVNVAAVIDTRATAPQSKDFQVIAGGQIVNTQGRLGINVVEIAMPDGTTRSVSCGGLGVSGGWNPNVHLTCHQRGRPVWREDIAAFVPGETLPVGMQVVGAANGTFSTHGALETGAAAAVTALEALDMHTQPPVLPEAEDAKVAITPFWHVAGARRAWLDMQNDVTVKDIKLAHQENFRSVEHLKRYTTLGMATDQGKTANIGGLAVMAEIAGTQIPEVGTTMYRPPYTPVAMGALAGRSRGKDLKPTRRTPSHDWAAANGATFVEAGLWLRAQYFTRPGETTWRQSVDREVLQTRKSVGICDVTSLGKVDVQGADAATFLNKVYSNPFAKLPVGRVRYGLMLREDGMVMDDGTAARLAEDHFVVTTTTANAVSVYRHMEFVRQCLMPSADVQLISTTEAWAQYSVAGPRARDLLRQVVDDAHDLSNEAFPFMACGPVSVGGVPARLFRISFSGELAYEIAVPTAFGDALIRRLVEAGKAYDAVVYGTEALGVMRIEKGHVTGNELNGTVSALNIGMPRMVSDKKDSIGTVLSKRPEMNTEDALKLVGLKAPSETAPLPAGAHLMNATGPVNAAQDQGYVTSACYSPHVGRPIALAFLKSGDSRLGETVRVVSPLTGVDAVAEVVGAHFVDPEGERLRG